MTEEKAPDPFAEVPVPSPRKEEEERADSLGNYRRPDRPPILSPRQIRRLADDRANLLFCAILIGTAYAVIFLIFRFRVVDVLPIDRQQFVGMLIGAIYLLHVPAVVFAWRLKSPMSPSQPAAFLLSALVCVPLLGLLICLTLFQESKVVLEKHGVGATLATVDRSTLPGPDANSPDQPA